MLRLVAIGIAVCGCKGPTADELRAAAKETRAQPTCESEAKALAKLLREAPHEPQVFQAQRGLTLVSRPDLPVTSTEYAPVVVMTRTETSYQGRLVDDPAQLGEQLEVARERLDASPAGAGAGTKRLYFQIDREVPWSRIVPLVEVADRAGFVEPAFVFDAPAKLVPPPRSAVDDKLDALMNSEDASNKATTLASITSDIVKDCAAIQRAFGAVGASESGNKADALIEGLEPALVECKCAVDIPSLRSVLWRLLVVAPVIRIVAFDESREQTIALPGSTTWEAASKRFTSKMRGARLVIE